VKLKAKHLLKFILLPVSAIYAGLTGLRNFFYDSGWLTSQSFPVPLISIGNLSVGGTGKTPHIEYLIKLLHPQFRLATLSRGYKRKTTGFLTADRHSDADLIGDEPLQIKMKFPEITVAVGENRTSALHALLQQKPQIEVVLLDDAFQHRRVKPKLSVLLTDYQNLFTRDLPLPSGRLRECFSGYRRADIIIVSKCPESLSPKEKSDIRKEINPKKHQSLYFSYLQYGNYLHSLTDEAQKIDLSTLPEFVVLLVCGIANPGYLTDFLRSNANQVKTMVFEDHHVFTPKDLKLINQKFHQISEPNKIIITTEKDSMRLLPFQQELRQLNLPVYCLSVEVCFLPDETEALKQDILRAIRS